MQSSRQVRTLPEYVKAISELPTPGYWFRGQKSAYDGKLRPAIYRKSRFATDEALYREDLLLSEFIRLGRPLSPSMQTHWEWYFLMQHFGVPTRLLDWTDNALAALYFAVGESEPPEHPVEDPVVFALDPSTLNHEMFGRTRLGNGKRPSGIVSPDWDAAQPWLAKDRFRRKVRVKYPVAINPPHIDRRIAAQGSRFYSIRS